MKPSKVSELLEKVNRLAGSSDFSKLSKLELDLLMQHLRDLYNEVDVVRNAVGQATNNTEDLPVITSTPEVKVIKRTLNPNENILIKEQDTVEKKVSVVEKELPVTTPKEMVVEQTPTKKEIIVEQATNNSKVSKSSINESVLSSSASLNEKLKADSKEVHKKLSSKPLKDLIDLNKKFVLQNELFKGNSTAFATAVQSIDSFDNITVAENYVAQLQQENNWDATSQTTRLFVKLVKQKFGAE